MHESPGDHLTHACWGMKHSASSQWMMKAAVAIRVARQRSSLLPIFNLAFSEAMPGHNGISYRNGVQNHKDFPRLLLDGPKKSKDLDAGG